MNVLVIGNGGREHTLVWKLGECASVTRILWAPGNPAAKVSAKVRICPIPLNDIAALLDLAQKENVQLTVVGPEGPLVQGVADQFTKAGLAIFGPTQNAARLEGSKVFSKRFFLKYGIPTGRAEFFTSFEKAVAYARTQPKPLVVKADGLAAGKGVIICKTDEEAEQALRDILENKIFGIAGSEVLIEECLSGPEVSVHAVTDGHHYQILASAQDHKRVRDGDEGPNTGGMGTYSPSPLFTSELEQRIRVEIFDRTLAGLKAEGIPYCGVLYAGLMLTQSGPMILEYNCRFGDPETQVILSRLDSDLAEALLAICHGDAKSVSLRWKPEAAVCVVLAAGGYPGTFRKGDPVEGLEKAAGLSDLQIFHAGTSLQDNRVVTSGGRVFGVTALGVDFPEAIKKAYAGADLINFEGKFCRRDIAKTALTESQKA